MHKKVKSEEGRVKNRLMPVGYEERKNFEAG